MSISILNDITQQFHHAASGWHAYLFPIAHQLFGLLAVIEIAWAGIWWSIEKSEVNSLCVEMLKKFVSIGIFYTILIHSNTWIPAIIQSFIKIGAGASGHTQLFPSDVMEQGISIAGNIFKVFHDTGITSFGLSTLIGAFAGLTVLFSFAVIAGLLVVTLVESYMVLSAGVLMLGFASHRLASKFATNYISYAMSVGVKLFMLYLVLGVGGSLANDWINRFSHLTTVDISPFLEVAGGAWVYLFCAWAIPHKAESLLSGASNATLGNVVAATAATVSAGKAISSTAKSVGGSVMGGASASMEAIKQASSLGKSFGGSIGAYATGGIVAGVNLASSALGSLTGHHPTASKGMKEKTASINTYVANRAEKKASQRPTQTPPPH